MAEEGSDWTWKEIGNRAFQEKKYEEAVNAYTAGLKATPSDVSLLSNRSINYLNLEMYSMALADAESVLKLEPKHAKGIYRKVKALIGGRKYGTALNFILAEDNKNILNSFTSENNLGQKLLEQVHVLVEQERIGNYNMAEILREKSFEHELADYNVPVAIEIFEGRGRGLVSTEKISAGQLVIGSKAFAFIVERNHRKKKASSGEGGQTESDPEEDYSVDKDKAKASLVEAIVEKMKKSPEEARVIYTLYAGKKLGNLELDDCLNNPDIERIRKIVDSNAFFADGRITYAFMELMGGVWLLPSFINHSCYDGNVKWHMHGDFLSIRAIKDIKVGEELRMSYVSPLESLASRQEILSSYEVTCNCSLCKFQIEESNEIKDRITAGTKSFKNLLSVPGGMVSTETAELEQIVNELESIHPGNHQFCPFILEPYKYLARRYFRKENYEKSVEILEKGRRLVVGTELTDLLVTFTTNIITCYLKNKNKAKAIEWVRELEQDIRVCYGEPVDEVLQVIAPDLVSKLKLEKIKINN